MLLGSHVQTNDRGYSFSGLVLLSLGSRLVFRISICSALLCQVGLSV